MRRTSEEKSQINKIFYVANNKKTVTSEEVFVRRILAAIYLSYFEDFTQLMKQYDKEKCNYEKLYLKDKMRRIIVNLKRTDSYNKYPGYYNEALKEIGIDKYIKNY